MRISHCTPKGENLTVVWMNEVGQNLSINHKTIELSEKSELLKIICKGWHLMIFGHWDRYSTNLQMHKVVRKMTWMYNYQQCIIKGVLQWNKWGNWD